MDDPKLKDVISSILGPPPQDESLASSELTTRANEAKPGTATRLALRVKYGGLEVSPYLIQNSGYTGYLN